MQRSLSPARRAYRHLNRPYYWWRPSQLARRAVSRPASDGSTRLLRTAWGSHLVLLAGPARAGGRAHRRVRPDGGRDSRSPGRSWRDRNRRGRERGLVSNLLAYAVGRGGRVVSFEPHPLIFETLNRNVSRWQARRRSDATRSRSARRRSPPPPALSLLRSTPRRSHTTRERRRSSSADSDATRPTSKRSRLDDEFSTPIGVLKLDVERHELAAQREPRRCSRTSSYGTSSSRSMLPPPTAVTALLEVAWLCGPRRPPRDWRPDRVVSSGRLQSPAVGPAGVARHGRPLRARRAAAAPRLGVPDAPVRQRTALGSAAVRTYSDQLASAGTSMDAIVRAALAAARPERGLRWLDIGCGRGDLLRDLRDEMASPRASDGVDPIDWLDEDLRATSTSTRGRRGGDGLPHRRPRAAGGGDRAPRGAVERAAQAAQLVAPGGRIVVSTPNLATLRNRLELGLRGRLTSFRPDV